MSETDRRINEIGTLTPREAVVACRAEVHELRRRIDSLRTSLKIARVRQDPSQYDGIRVKLHETFILRDRFEAAQRHHERLRDKQELHEAWCLVVSARYGAIVAAECCAEAVRLCVTHSTQKAFHDSATRQSPELG